MPQGVKETIQDVITHSKLIYPDNPENLEIIYTNSITIQITDRDVMFDLGIRRPELAKNPNEIPSQITKRIFISLHHAKMFSLVLQTAIAQFEDDFAPIQIEPAKK